MTLVVKVFGVDDCMRAFAELPRTIQNRTMRVALSSAGGVIRDAAVANAPKETGLLRRSLKVKVRVPNASYDPKHHGRPAYAVVGPQRRIFGLAKTVRGRVRAKLKRGFTKKGTARVRRPSRYAHLVEKGTRRGVKATRFLARAVASHGEAAKLKMLQKCHDGVMNWARTRRARALVRT